MWTDKDFPPRPWDGKDWATGLESLTLPGLSDMYLDFVPTLNSRNGTASTNWVELNQRMRWVLPLFRGRQDSARNFCNLFTNDQVADIWAGNAPKERGLCIPYDLQCCNM